MSVFDEIVKRTPLNKIAYDVTSTGEHFYFDPQNLHPMRSDLPLPTTTRHFALDEEDLTGRVAGRFTVIGRWDSDFKHRSKIRWVVRCVCGFYETRRGSIIKRGTAEQQMCSGCRLLEDKKIEWNSGVPENERFSIAPGLGENRLFISPNKLADIEPIFIPQNKQRFGKTPIPPEIRWRVWERDNFTCQHCGSRKHLAVDHILAESKGGMMVLENLQTLCGRCNSKKGAR